MENKSISPQERNYLNVPLSIISQRWFKSDNAVRAWIFYAWESLLPHWEGHRTKTVKGKTFQLNEGEMICTRSYLAKSLGISDSAAKGNTDKLKRTDSISVKQEILSKDIVKVPKNRLSRVKVKGVPVPNEPYIKMSFPVETADMWTVPYLAQLYIYMMCIAFHKESYIVGTAGKAKHVSAGDMLLNYGSIMETLRCKEWQLKRNLRTLEDCGAIQRLSRIGNRGILVHLNYYPEKKEKTLEVKTDDLNESVTNSNTMSENGDSANKPLSPVPANTVQPHSVTSQAVPAPSYPHSYASSSSAEILNTHVTDAIKYLFFEKKGNKDVEHLNQIIEYINENLPERFPIEKLRDAMDDYYAEHGEKYIDKLVVLKSINQYYTKYRSNRVKQIENDSKKQNLENELQKIRREVSKFSEDWKLVGQLYSNEQKAPGYINSLDIELVRKVYYTLWCANLRGNYLDKASLEQAPTKEHPESWDGDLCKQADYVIEFLSRFENIEALRTLYNKENERVSSNTTKRWKEIMSQLENFKKVG